jgi:predicted nucleic acid-binding protein
MAAFVDTSGLLKLYVPETGSRWMHSVVRTLGITIGAVTFTEIGSSLSRRVREGDLSPGDARDAWKTFRRESRSFIVVPLTRQLLVAAANLSARSVAGLRTLDALQLQAAVQARDDALASKLTAPFFISADVRLLAAAGQLGFATDNPLDHL